MKGIADLTADEFDHEYMRGLILQANQQKVAYQRAITNLDRAIEVYTRALARIPKEIK